MFHGQSWSATGLLTMFDGQSWSTLNATETYCASTNFELQSTKSSFTDNMHWCFSNASQTYKKLLLTMFHGHTWSELLF